MVARWVSSWATLSWEPLFLRSWYVQCSLGSLSTFYTVPPQISLGEMIAFLPIPGGHIKLAERFVSPAFSLAMGWNYWYNWTITGSFTPCPPCPYHLTVRLSSS